MQLRITLLMALTLLANGCGQTQRQDNQKNQQETSGSTQEIKIIETANGLIKKKLAWATFSDSKTEKYIQFRLNDGEVYAYFPVYFYASKSYKSKNTIADEAAECSGEEPSLNKEDFTKTNYMNSREVSSLKKIILSSSTDHFVSYCKKYDVYGEFMGVSADIDFRFSHPAHEWPAKIQYLFNEVRGITPEKISIESEFQSL